MEERKDRLRNYDRLNVCEAVRNNFSTVRVDFKKPTQDLIGGLPGFGRGYERTH